MGADLEIIMEAYIGEKSVCCSRINRPIESAEIKSSFQIPRGPQDKVKFSVHSF